MDTDIDKRGFRKFGKTLKELRESKELSLRELAQISEIDHSQIAKIEKGRSNVHFSTILKLARAMGVQPGTFAARPLRLIIYCPIVF